MVTKQISIFVENRQGALAEVTRLLGDNGIDIQALSIADTADFGILRIIVESPETVLPLLREHAIVASITEVLMVGIEDRPGGLADVLQLLSEHQIQVEYVYAFVSRVDRLAYVVMRSEKWQEADEILRGAGYSD